MRARLNVTDREVIKNMSIRSVLSISIDPQTQKMYWIEWSMYTDFSILSADMNGNNERTLFNQVYGPQYESWVYLSSDLRVFKDSIYWRDRNRYVMSQIPKHLTNETYAYPRVIAFTEWYNSIAFNYVIEGSTQGISLCKALKSMLPNYSATDNSESLSVTTDPSLPRVNETSLVHSFSWGEYLCVWGIVTLAGSRESFKRNTATLAKGY